MALVDQLSSLFHNLRKPIAATGLAVKTSASQAATSAPTITSGSGAPSASEPDGSVYMRTGGTAVLTSFYVRVSSAWVAVADELLRPGVEVLLADPHALAEGWRLGMVEDLRAAAGTDGGLDSA